MKDKSSLFKYKVWINKPEEELTKGLQDPRQESKQIKYGFMVNNHSLEPDYLGISSSFTSCYITLGKFLSISEPQFPYLESGETNSSSFIRLC